MNSARERAVEAGARAICADYDELPELATWAECKAKSDRLWVDRQEVHEDVAVILRAAFPILAEDAFKRLAEYDKAHELLATGQSWPQVSGWLITQGWNLEGRDYLWWEGYATATILRHLRELALRARIQQMAEAEHE